MSIQLIVNKPVINYTPPNEVGGGVYWNHLVSFADTYDYENSVQSVFYCYT